MAGAISIHPSNLQRPRVPCYVIVIEARAQPAASSQQPAASNQAQAQARAHQQLGSLLVTLFNLLPSYRLETLLFKDPVSPIHLSSFFLPSSFHSIFHLFILRHHIRLFWKSSYEIE
ncbi:hypothetical protein BofuT4_P022250.1 [Botrytis cinerea T4]|uniref:Uncharacterized protein n=1 Tax=Botryotinia fuckeliana (strain T4) TaxID=999810 RepID=G2YGS3_BOTF4|nr:hypothetical protein BofuT4_P022250.1 [Botrytis cinerea T4]